MKNLKNFVFRNQVNIAVTLFISFFFIIHYIQPAALYNIDGDFKEFGVGYRHKTIFPIWIVSIVMAILSYLAVLYYLAYF
jgi:tetrahydromethanopterin S-methyltransferase subunit D